MRIAGLMLPVVLLACSAEKGGPAAPPPPLVTVSTPVRRDVVTYIETSGRMQAVATVDIRARVEGFLEKLEFEPGTTVEKDQVLFVIEKANYSTQRDQAKADVAAATAAREKAKSDLERIEQAYETNAVSGTQVTEARALYSSAEAAVLSAEAALERAELMLSYCDVRSPIDGLVSRNYVDIGNLVGPANNPLLTTVVDRQPIYVYFEIPEAFVNYTLREMARSRDRGERRKAPVRIALPDETDFAFEGRADWFDNRVDPDTGTLRARAVFANEELLLFPGVFVRVRIIGPPNEDAILVEEKAMSIDLGGKYLLLVGENDVVERRYVTAGQLEGTMRVIDEGLEGDERYISDGLLRARPGLPVRVQDAGAAE